MRKSEHRPGTGAADASGAATAPARQAVQPSPSPEQDDTAPRPEGPESFKAPDAREARVAELRRKHADGTYKVDARKLSAKIVDRHLNK